MKPLSVRKAKNMHLSRRQEKIHGTGGMGKAVVHGLIQRGEKKDQSQQKDAEAQQGQSHGC